MSISTAMAQINPETMAAERAYEKCAMTTAEHFSSGIDAADLIAQAATEACRPQMQAVARAVQKEGQSGAFLVSFIEELNKDLVKKVKLQVLELRAKKP